MPVIAPGSDWDLNGCIASAGYTFCEVLGRCIRLWEESCQIPNNCLTWNDGCNTCSVSDGKLALCTEMYCFAQGTPNCMVYEPDIIVDPSFTRPPVINPFLQGSSVGGH